MSIDIRTSWKWATLVQTEERSLRMGVRAIGAFGNMEIAIDETDNQGGVRPVLTTFMTSGCMDRLVDLLVDALADREREVERARAIEDMVEVARARAVEDMMLDEINENLYRERTGTEE